MTDDRAPQIRYAVRLWLLQERACLSYCEARAYLMDERCETLEDLAKAFSCTTDQVSDIRARAERKVSEANAVRDVFMGYGPIPADSRFDCHVEDRNCDWGHGIWPDEAWEPMEKDWRKTDFGPGERPATFEEVEAARKEYWTFRWRLYGAVWSTLVVDLQRRCGCTRLQARSWCTVNFLGISGSTWGRLGVPLWRVYRSSGEAKRRMSKSSYELDPAIRMWLGANLPFKLFFIEDDPLFGDARPLWREFARIRTACEGVWTPPHDPVYPDSLSPAAKAVAVSAAIDAVQRRFSVEYPTAIGIMVRLGRSAELHGAGFGDEVKKHGKKGRRVDLDDFELPKWLVPWLDLCSKVE